MKKVNWTKIDKVLNVLFSLGAAVVIFAALAKILHWRNSDIFLAVGMLTEVGIFLSMGIIESVRPKEKTVEMSKVTGGGGHSVPQLHAPDISQELILFRSQLERINKMMANILNSSKQ